MDMALSKKPVTGVKDILPAEMQLRDYVMEMAQITHTESELRFGAIPYSTTGIVSLWPDVSKLEHELDWSAKRPFAVGINTILDIMNNQMGNNI